MPSAIVSSASFDRPASGSNPSTTSDHPSRSTTRGSSERRRTWSRSSSRNRSGPPARCTTPSGTPLGSIPTEKTGESSASFDDHQRVAPRQSAECRRTRRRRSARAPERFHRPRAAAKTARAESALSVSPISTCLASLVTRGSASPASRAMSVASAATAARLPIPASRNRCSTAASSRSISALGGSAHSGSGIRSIFRRFKRCDTTRVSRPRASSCATVSFAARVKRRLFSGRRLPPLEKPRTVDADLEELRASVERHQQSPRTSSGALLADHRRCRRGYRSRSRRQHRTRTDARPRYGPRSRPHCDRQRRSRPNRTSPPRSAARETPSKLAWRFEAMLDIVTRDDRTRASAKRPRRPRERMSTTAPNSHLRAVHDR